VAGFKDLTFNERRAAAQEARGAALAKFKAKPPIEEAELERRRIAAEAKEAAQAEKRRALAEAKRLAEEARIAAEEAARLEAERIKAEQEAAAALLVELTEEERKAARDAKYAARKAKKGKR
jgi:hypothetical protein